MLWVVCGDLPSSCMKCNRIASNLEKPKTQLQTLLRMDCIVIGFNNKMTIPTYTRKKRDFDVNYHVQLEFRLCANDINYLLREQKNLRIWLPTCSDYMASENCDLQFGWDHCSNGRPWMYVPISLTSKWPSMKLAISRKKNHTFVHGTVCGMWQTFIGFSTFWIGCYLPQVP